MDFSSLNNLPNGTYSHRINRMVDDECLALPSSADYAYNKKYNFPSSDECVPLQAWQTALYPSCNTMHEIDAHPSDENFIFINCGSNCCMFLIQGSDGSKSVLKTLRCVLPELTSTLLCVIFHTFSYHIAACSLHSKIYENIHRLYLGFGSY